MGSTQVERVCNASSRKAKRVLKSEQSTKSRLQQLRRSTSLPRMTDKFLKTIGFNINSSLTKAEFGDVLSTFRNMAFSASNAEDFSNAYLMSEILSKWDGDGIVSVTDHDREVAAANTFWEGEDACKAANYRLAAWDYDVNVPTEVIHRARRIIAGLLGEFPWEELPRACGFGPGASTFLRRADSSHQNKWQSARHITATCLPYLLAFQKWAHLDAFAIEVEIVGGNRVTTVPKSWKTFRTIAVEPCWNSFFQKGVGKLIRRRLRGVGLLHKDAQKKHGRLAQEGSITKELATVDLKSASDTLSIGLIEAVIPDGWLRVLRDLRSPVGEIAGVEYRYQKWSSMGNGYTFELETLVFYALARAVCNKKDQWAVSVYGDDIILPSTAVMELQAVFKACGLTFNTTKSFWGSHPFRESCGSHFFNGVDVTPFYLRSELKTAGDLITLANHCRSWGIAHNEPSLLTTWSSAYRILPPVLRGPKGQEGALWCEWDEARPIYRPELQAFEISVIHREHRYTDVWTWTGSYLFKLWTQGDEEETLEVSYLSRATSREVVKPVFIDRCSWPSIC